MRRLAAAALVLVACGRGPATEQDRAEAAAAVGSSRSGARDGSRDRGRSGARDGRGDGSRSGNGDGSGDGSRSGNGDGSGDGSRSGNGDGALARARLLELRLPGAGAPPCARVGRGADPGRVEALLDAGAGPPRWAALRLSLRERPRAWRRPLAFARLAAALGARAVPSVAARRIGAGEVASLLEGQPGAPELLRELAVLNDGTVDAIAIAPGPGPPGPAWDLPAPGAGGACPRRAIAVEGAPEVEAWARWASSPAPVPGERPALVRGYVEALALDYLSGLVARRELVVDDAAGALILEDNAEAFPARVHEHAPDRLLTRLAAVARFPRSLRDGLHHLGRGEAAALLAPGSLAPAGAGPAPLTGFAGWLVSPRTLVDLDERRAALLTLIEAKIAAHGEAAALSL